VSGCVCMYHGSWIMDHGYLEQKQQMADGVQRVTFGDLMQHDQ